MKMRLLLVQIFAFSFIHALYLGNVDSPGAITTGIWIPQESLVGVKLGYQADFIIDRRLKSYGGLRSRMDTFQAQLNQGVLTLMVANRVEAYGSVGSMQATFSHRPAPSYLQREYQTSYKTTWGFGARAVVYDGKYCAIGVSGAYQYAKLPLKWDALSGTTFRTNADLHYQEWQVGTGISKQIDIFIPYLAVKYSNVWAKTAIISPDLELPVRHITMKNRDYFGLVVGCTFTTGSDFGLTLESRFIDEQAFTLALDLSF
ncbi:MAG: major outer membrane protein [Chlamydiota bacterium]|jgi:hypothetical protein